ncbi:MAG: alpha/beta hydrolase [Mycobacteriales bacterium]
MRMDLSFRESGAGRPLVLLHAFPLSSAMWLAQREGLADVCRVITPDQRGFGGTPLGHDEPSLDEAADDIAAMLDRLGLDRVVLGGLSMGGYVALAFLRRYPERVAALVLADTKATADPPAAAETRERIALAVLAGEEGVLVEEVLPRLVGQTTRDRRALVLGRVKALVQGAPAYAVAWAERAMAARPDSTPDLARIGVPTLVVVGEQDELSTPAEAQAMAAAIPGARLVQLAGAGHLSAVEVPEEFNAAVREFLVGLD